MAIYNTWHDEWHDAWMDDLDRYQLKVVLGQGEMGTVFAAYDPLFERNVALKVLREDIVPNARESLSKEAFILSHYDHPGVPAFYDYVSTDDPNYMVFEHIGGRDLQTILEETGDFLPTYEVVTWIIELCDTLAHIHTHAEAPAVVYDIKPAHVMIDNFKRARLIDFGLAQQLPEDGYLANAALVGTEGFAPPEQYQGHASPLNDIFSLGATLHYALTRIDPRKERLFTFAPARSINKSLPRALAAVIARATTYEPEDRYQTAAEMKAALEDALL